MEAAELGPDHLLLLQLHLAGVCREGRYNWVSVVANTTAGPFRIPEMDFPRPPFTLIRCTGQWIPALEEPTLSGSKV